MYALVYYDDTSLIGSTNPMPGRPVVIYRVARRNCRDKKNMQVRLQLTGLLPALGYSVRLFYCTYSGNWF
jgi:hypothetical protein